MNQWKSYLAMSAPGLVRRGESLVDFEDGLLHRDLLDDSAREFEVVSRDDEDGLLGDILLREAVLEEKVANVRDHADPERLLARHERERAR